MLLDLVAAVQKSFRIASKTAKVWDAASGRKLRTLAGHTAEVRGVAFSPDGTRLATASEDQTTKVWAAATGRELVTLAGHAARVLGMDLSPDGTHMATTSPATREMAS